MTLRNICNGPDWIIWTVFGNFAIMSTILLAGHGANLVAGYHMTGKEEKSKLTERK